jgi:hypothetical protein
MREHSRASPGSSPTTPHDLLLGQGVYQIGDVVAALVQPTGRVDPTLDDLDAVEIGPMVSRTAWIIRTGAPSAAGGTSVGGVLLLDSCSALGLILTSSDGGVNR